MLDPRVYRAAFIPAAFALIVAAFSLREPPRGSSTSLAPDAFVGARAFAGPGTGLRRLAGAYPQRRPGDDHPPLLGRHADRAPTHAGRDRRARRSVQPAHRRARASRLAPFP